MQIKQLSTYFVAAATIVHGLAITVVLATTDTYYTAAVFEFVQTQNCTMDPEDAKQVVKHNLDAYVPVAKLAKSKGADIIDFPEYGIFPECNRVQTQLFCEVIPDPDEGKCNPCMDQQQFADRPQLITLSCMARNNSIVVHANTCHIHRCEREPRCPPDGHMQFNTNVVFDRDGTLLIRYLKEHLYQEYAMNEPKRMQNPKFTTDFGTFLSYVCYDIFFERAIQVEKEDTVDGIVFSTMWENTMPLLMTVGFFQSFVMGTNLTLIGADIQLPGQKAVGSGIFHGPYGALAYTFNPDGISKLVVARVPRRGYALTEPKSSITAVFENGTTFDYISDGDHVEMEGSENILPHWQNDYLENRYHVINMENYTLIKITEPSAYIEGCNNGLCCVLDYSAENITQNFYMAIFNGMQETFSDVHWSEENCMLVRCDPADGKECAAFPLRAEVVFHHVYLRANFSTQYIYPSVIGDRMRLIPRSQWEFSIALESGGYNGIINFNSDEGQKLIVVGFKGRCYDRDPPFSFF
ncbi:biotinidase [Nephila pilipes]|uniref:Biotinidase n=1 Tax=Nephila pilipes TaxID=299642 RepID=A0A8X6I8N4_NEPPI|nr:biotinidase [Nephila pilipes]